MADDELYRKKIVIEVVDNDAVAKVNAFEKKFQSSMDKVKTMAGNTKPKININDDATSKINRISSIIKKLGNMKVSPVISIKDKATSVLSGISSKIKSIGRALTSPLGLLGVGVSAAGAIQGGIIQPLNLAGNMEQSQIAFETMLGSAQKANKFLHDMQKFAASTPFEFPELQENAKLMLAFGFNTQKILPMLKTIGDTAAGLGAGSEGIERMVRALGQMQAKGRVQTEELLQLQELGVPVNEILRQELKLTNEQIANIGKEGIASSKVINAILRGMEKRFGGLMDKQSRSLKGLWSNIKDTFQMKVLWRWGEGIRKAVQPRLQAITDWFDKNEKTIEKWGDQLEKISGQAADWMMKKMEGAMRYIEGKYINNPEFQKLNFQGKINFIVGDLSAKLGAWFNNEGIPIIASYGAKIGAAMISAMATSATNAVMGNPLLALLLGTYIGLKTGNPYIGLVVGISLASVPPILNWLYKMGNKLSVHISGTSTAPAYQAKKQQRAIQNAKKYVEKNGPIGTSIRARASGGILTTPHIALVAEEGPESIIPLSPKRRSRAIQLWQETGKRLGLIPAVNTGSATINLNFDMNGLIGQIVMNNKDEIDSAAEQAMQIALQKIKNILQNLP